MKKKEKKKAKGASGPPGARLPLPAKPASRHGDKKKYDRKKEKERLLGET